MISSVRKDERGFGMIEILVSMFLLALLSMAVLPILVQGLRQSTANSTLAAATQLANQQMELVRPLTSCGAIVPADVTVTTQGVSLQAARTIAATCPASGYPITVPVSVTVTRADTGATVASASTLVFVSGP